jgi:hypothetical protein
VLYLRFLRPLDPEVAFKGTSDALLWGDDQVHPTEAGYDLLAAQVIRLTEMTTPVVVKKRKRDEAESGADSRGDRSRAGPTWGGGCAPCAPERFRRDGEYSGGRERTYPNSHVLRRGRGGGRGGGNGGRGGGSNPR